MILCRMIQPISVGGVGYFEFVPTRFPDGKIRAVDVYIMSTAEFFSAALRRAVLPTIANRAQSIVDRLLKNEQDYIRDLPKLTGILDLMNQGRMKEALAEFGELRPETKKQKTVLMIRLRAAQPVDQKQYAAVLEEFRTLYPKDPCFDLLSIDYYTLKRDFVRALESVDRLDKSLGGDPYLNVIRASLSEPRGDLAEARRFARLAIDQEPRLLSAYLELLGISLLDKKNDQTLAMLKEIDLTFHLQLRDLKTVPAYAGFVRSPHYKQWMQYLERRDKDRTQKHDQSPARARRKVLAP